MGYAGLFRFRLGTPFPMGIPVFSLGLRPMGFPSLDLLGGLFGCVSTWKTMTHFHVDSTDVSLGSETILVPSERRVSAPMPPPLPSERVSDWARTSTTAPQRSFTPPRLRPAGRGYVDACVEMSPVLLALSRFLVLTPSTTSLFHSIGELRTLPARACH
jgi:hypothetical protein